MIREWLCQGRRNALFAGSLAASLSLLPVAWAGDLAQDGRHWVATWQGSPQTFDPLTASLVPLQPSYANQTLREIVHISIGGPQVRLRLTNSYGTQSLVIGAVHVARAGEGSTIRTATDRAVTFGGEGGITIGTAARLGVVTLSGTGRRGA